MAPSTQKAILLSGILTVKSAKEEVQEANDTPRVRRARGNY